MKIEKRDYCHISQLKQFLTAPYPGFATDLQQPITPLLLKAEGREANEYYFETKQEACDFSFNMPLYSMFRNVLFYIRKIKQFCAIIQSI